jgi:hypothetical protein
VIRETERRVFEPNTDGLVRRDMRPILGLVAERGGCDLPMTEVDSPTICWLKESIPNLRAFPMYFCQLDSMIAVWPTPSDRVMVRIVLGHL